MPNEPKPKSTPPIHKVTDIMPAGKILPGATSRPIIVGTSPKHNDNTLTKRPLMSHHSSQPLLLSASFKTPSTSPKEPATMLSHEVKGAPPLASSAAGSSVPIAAFPPLDDHKTAPSPRVSPSSAPAVPNKNAVAHTKPAAFVPPVPEVGAPPMPAAEVASEVAPQDEPEELDLASLTGVHGIVPETPPSDATTPSSASTSPASPPARPVMQQTPEQAKKLAAALRELKHTPAAPAEEKPIISIHKHEYGRAIVHFLLAFIICAVLGALVFDLLLDAQIINLPLIPATNFFH